MDAAVIAAAIAAFVSLVGVVLTYRASRQATGATDRANNANAMLKWAEQLALSEKAAREEAQESRDRADRIKDEADADIKTFRRQLDDLQLRLNMANDLAGQLTETLTMVAAEVWRPEPDIPALRRLVGRPGVNGR